VITQDLPAEQLCGELRRLCQRWEQKPTVECADEHHLDGREQPERSTALLIENTSTTNSKKMKNY